MLATLLFSLHVTGPILLAIAAGLILKQLGCLPASAIRWGSAFMFYISLPLLMFTSILRQPLMDALQPLLVGVGLLVTLGIYFLAQFLAVSVVKGGLFGGFLRGDGPRHYVMAEDEKAVFVQACYRGNLGIVGLSLCLNAYGQSVLADVSVLMALLTITYNVLSVWLFVKVSSGRLSLSSLTLQLIRNPLISAIVVGMAVNLMLGQFSIVVDKGLIEGVDEIVKWSLPVALICVGGSMTMKNMRGSGRIIALAATVKLVVMPVLALLIAFVFSLSAVATGMLFLLCAAPTATASFIMARAYCAETSPAVPLTANLIVVTTLLSMLSITVWVFILRSNGII